MRDIDYEALKRELKDIYGAQSASYSGIFGFIDMMDVDRASHDELERKAREEGIDLDKFRR